MKKTVLCFIAVLVLGINIVTSASSIGQVSYDITTDHDINYLNISGVCDGDNVSLEILNNEDKDMIIDSENVLTKVLYVYDTRPISNEFQFHVPLSEKMINTNLFVRIGKKGDEDIYSFSVLTMNDTQKTILNNYINTMTAGELEQIFNEKWESYSNLGYKIKIYNDFSEETFKSDVCQMLATGNRPYSDSCVAFNGALCVASINYSKDEQDIKNCFGNFNDLLLLENEEGYNDIVSKNYENTLAQNILNNCPYKDFSSFKDKLSESISKTLNDISELEVIDQINKCTAAEMIGILEKYKEFTGLDVKKSYENMTTQNKDKFLTTMANTEFVTKKQLISEIERLLEKYKQTVGGGSTGSSGGSSGNVSTTVTLGHISENGEIKIEENQTENTFSDLDDVGYAIEAIEYLYKEKIVSGISEKCFAPQKNVTREQAMKMIVNSFELPSVSQKNIGFIDVNEDDWFYSFVNDGVSSNIATGISTDLFGVGEFITRQDLLTMLYRGLEMMGKVTNINVTIKFEDDMDISEYAKDAVAYFSSLEIINGYEGENGKMFLPKNNATRAESAKMIYEVIKKCLK